MDVGDVGIRRVSSPLYLLVDGVRWVGGGLSIGRRHLLGRVLHGEVSDLLGDEVGDGVLVRRQPGR